MIKDGDYSRQVLACDAIVQGTAICHKGGKCSGCEFAQVHKVTQYLKETAEFLGVQVVPSVPLFKKMGESMQEYGRPLNPLKPIKKGEVPVFCPCEPGITDIYEKGRCQCGIFQVRTNNKTV